MASRHQSVAEEKRKAAIKKLQDKFQYQVAQLDAGIAPSKTGADYELRKERTARRKKNEAANKKRKLAEAKSSAKEAEWGKYEAQNKAGVERSAADRARHMELVLGKDWRKQVEDGPAIRAMLKKGDARRRALDPKNDPGFLASLRNKTGIMPTDAEIERRLRAKQNTRAEQARLTEGEAEAKAQLQLSAKELATDKGLGELGARRRFQKLEESDVQKEEDREASDTATLAILREREKERKAKEKEARRQEYKSFIAESRLDADAKRRSGEGVTRERTDTLEDLGTEALRENKLQDMARHAEYRDRRIRDKELGAGGNTALDIEAERLAKQKSIEAEEGPKVQYGTGDEGKKTGFLQKRFQELPLVGGMFGEKPKDLSGDGQVAEEAYLRDKAGAEKAPWELQKEEASRKELQEQDLRNASEIERMRKGEEPREPLMDTSEAGRETAESEFAASKAQDEMKQDEARKAIGGLDEEEANAVGQEIMRIKGPRSPEAVDAMEAMRDKDGRQRYVEYEGSGLVINMAALEKDIQRNENMAMLKNIPAANRPAMMAAWGYINPEQLSIAQKQSAKELKELSLLDLKIANAKITKTKLQSGLSGEKKVEFDAAHKGMLDAAKNGNYALADMYRRKINKINPNTDTTDYEMQFEKMIQKNKKIVPAKLFKAAGLKSAEPYYKSRLEVSKAVSFLKTSKGTSKDWLDEAGLGKKVESGTHAGTTYAQLLENHGIYSWERLETGEVTPQGVPKHAMKDKEAYMNWALPEIKNSLLTGIWGNLHTSVEQLNSVEIEKLKAKKAKEVVDEVVDVEPSSFVHEDYVAPDHVQIAKDEKARKAKKRKAAEKKAAESAENKMAEELANEIQLKGGSLKRLGKKENKAALFAEALKEGEMLLRRKYLTQTVSGSGRDSKVEPAKFSSLEEVIRYFKNPDNAEELADQEPSLRHFISKK